MIRRNKLSRSGLKYGYICTSIKLKQKRSYVYTGKCSFHYGHWPYHGLSGNLPQLNRLLSNNPEFITGIHLALWINQVSLLRFCIWMQSYSYHGSSPVSTCISTTTLQSSSVQTGGNFFMKTVLVWQDTTSWSHPVQMCQMDLLFVPYVQ